MLCSCPVTHHLSRGPTTHFTYIIPHSSCILHSSSSNFKTKISNLPRIGGDTSQHLCVPAELRLPTRRACIGARDQIVIVHEAISSFLQAPQCVLDMAVHSPQFLCACRQRCSNETEAYF